MTRDIELRPSQIEPLDAIDGELIDGLADCHACGGSHSVQGGVIRCCCGDEHDVDLCCDCGHLHDGDLHPQAPCGDYRCCIN